ncbi:hypothetical protein AOLI_G00129800 [Acnodon oligacanthus]
MEGDSAAELLWRGAAAGLSAITGSPDHRAPPLNATGNVSGPARNSHCTSATGHRLESPPDPDPDPDPEREHRIHAAG